MVYNVIMSVVEREVYDDLSLIHTHMLTETSIGIRIKYKI